VIVVIAQLENDLVVDSAVEVTVRRISSAVGFASYVGVVVVVASD
jgi:hypothetical protein